MTLQQAIEMLKDLERHSSLVFSSVELDALKLGIEAGKLVESLRVGVPRHVIRLLPGETKE